MNLTDDTRPYYGRLPGVHPRTNKRIFIEDKLCIDGESATMTITTGYMIQREQFIDSLPDVVCYEGVAGLEKAFSDWLNNNKH